MSKTIGILGGMGPAATVDLFDLIVRHTPATRDQDHIPILINNDPMVPDRTAAILADGSSPLPKLVNGAQLLEKMGAQLLVMPCNTAHYYWAEMQQVLQIPLLHMIRETAQSIRMGYPQIQRVGVMGTDGTLAVKLYQDVLVTAGLTPIEPAQAQIDQMMEAIYAVKAGQTTGKPSELLKGVGARLIQQGAEILVMGCTEIPLALHDGDLAVPLLSPTEILAKAAIREARGR